MIQKSGLNSSPNEKKNILNDEDAEQNKNRDEMANTFSIELAHTSYLSKLFAMNSLKINFFIY